MIIYVAHEYGGKPENIEKAKKITHDLQVRDLENCYICPLTAFSHLDYNEIGYEEELELCFDLLNLCDVLIVASNISNGVRREIELAKVCNMKIIYLNGQEYPPYCSEVKSASCDQQCNVCFNEYLRDEVE